MKVKQILDESFERVKNLLLKRDTELRNLSKNLFWYDYLDAAEIDKVVKGQQLDKEKVRTWNREELGDYAIKF
jgi:ATP-dependent Zn protease